jgi:hypothetical protein
VGRRLRRSPGWLCLDVAVAVDSAAAEFVAPVLVSVEFRRQPKLESEFESELE